MSCGPNDRRGGKWRRRRLDWLLAHRKLWEHHKYTARSKSKRVLFEKMQARGLYSPTTAWFDTSVHELVKEARRTIDKEFDRAIDELTEEANRIRADQELTQLAATLMACLSRPKPS